MSTEIRVSVIVPLTDHRGQAIDCVNGWLAQSSRPEQYELIVIGSGADPELEREIRRRLRPHDSFLGSDSPNVFLLFNRGAQQASGRMLFFTESHCVPERTCLEAAWAEYRNGHVGGSCESRGLSPDELAMMEQRILEEVRDTDHWRKVLPHGFFIDREVFADIGGFSYEFGRFSESLLAARLHDRGHRLIHASRAIVRHRYAGSLEAVQRRIRSFTLGELAVRSLYPADFCERYFGPVEESEPPQSRLRMWRQLWAIRWARVRIRLWKRNEKRRWRAYRDYWSRVAVYWKLDFRSRHGDDADLGAGAGR